MRNQFVDDLIDYGERIIPLQGKRPVWQEWQNGAGMIDSTLPANCDSYGWVIPGDLEVWDIDDLDQFPWELPAHAIQTGRGWHIIYQRGSGLSYKQPWGEVKTSGQMRIWNAKALAEIIANGAPEVPSVCQNQTPQQNQQVTPGSNSRAQTVQVQDFVTGQEGSRNRDLTRMAGLMADRWPEADLTDVLEMVGTSWGLTVDEIRRTVEKSYVRWRGEQIGPKAEQASELVFRPLEDHDLTTPDFLVGDWLVKGSNVMLAGKPGVGKSHTVLGLVRAISTGVSWYGHVTNFKGRVFIIEGEMAPWSQSKRLHGEVLDKVFWCFQPDNYGWWDRPEVFDQMTREDLLIIDNKSALYQDPHPEVDAEHWARINKFLVSVDPTVILVHHSGKGANMFRGSSEAVRAVDLTMGLEEKDGQLQLTFGKKRLAETPAFINILPLSKG